jgi:hypothetical protein
MNYLFWILGLLNLLAPIGYEDYSSRCLLVSFIIIVIPYLKREDLLIALWFLYWTISDMFIIPTWHQNIIEYTLFSAWLCFLKFIPEITSLPYNDKNICITFYRGQNGSIKARLSALLGLDVTSTDILYRGVLWRYRHGKLIKSNAKHILDQFIYFDTGIKPSKKLDRLLSNLAEKPYKKSWYKPNCTLILSQFLVELQLQPKGLFQSIPSLYLRGLLHG